MPQQYQALQLLDGADLQAGSPVRNGLTGPYVDTMRQASRASLFKPPSRFLPAHPASRRFRLLPYLLLFRLSLFRRQRILIQPGQMNFL